MALGLNVIWGWSGDFDLAYYGYVAVGAYMTLVLTIGPAAAPAQYILGLQLPYPGRRVPSRWSLPWPWRWSSA